MKKDKIVYWIATGLVSAGMLLSAYMYLTKSPELVAGMQTIGLPLWFIGLLGTAKLLAAIALVVPIGNRLKEWAYAGLGFIFIGATWAHLATSTPFVAPLIFLTVTVVSYIFWGRVKNAAHEVKSGKVAFA